MDILIHTYGRADRQTTYKNLSPTIRDKVILVVQKREADLYQNYPNLLVLPEDITQLAETRQHLMDSYVAADNICILDDDLQFAVRRDDDRTRFRQPQEQDIDRMFNALEVNVSETVPLVGVGAREGGNFNPEPFLEATRQMRLHCINLPTYRKLGIRFDRVQVMEDFDVTLQFLEAGYPNLVLNDWVTNQAGSNTAGGCSHYRTLEVQAESAYRLAELHPGIVTAVKKSTKTSWGGKERIDVRVKWKQALAERRVNLLDQGERKYTNGEGERTPEAVE